MQVERLYQFPVTTPQRDIPRAWHLQEEADHILAVVYVTDKAQWPPASSKLSFLLLDLSTRTLMKEVTTTIAHGAIETLELAYDPLTRTWAMGDLEFQDISNTYQIRLRLLSHQENGHATITESAFADEANDPEEIGPLFALETAGETGTLVYLKPDFYDPALAGLYVARVDLANGQVVQQCMQAEAQVGLVRRAGKACLFVTYLDHRAVTREGGEERETKTAPGWSLWMIDGESYADPIAWRYSPELKRSVDENGGVHGMTIKHAFITSAEAIGGPLLSSTQRQTFVVGMVTMMAWVDAEEDQFRISAKNQVYNKTQGLLCIDTEGNILQTSDGSLGLYMQFCLSEKVVVGTDLLRDRWRLWNWFPLEEASFRCMTWLDQDVLRACMVREGPLEEQTTNHFWLIEEYREQITVSKRDAITLAEMTPAAVLKGVHLLTPQNGHGSLNWHSSIEVLFYRGSLLLLAVDDNDQLGLYQVK